MSPDPIGLAGGFNVYGGITDPFCQYDRFGLATNPTNAATCPNSNPQLEPKKAPEEAGEGAGATRLFRAVSPAELADIQATGGFRPSPTGLEGKYFSTTAEGAAQYARMAVSGFGDAPYTLVETTMPSGTAPLAPFVDRGIPTVVVPNTSLPDLGRPTSGRPCRSRRCNEGKRHEDRSIAPGLLGHRIVPGEARSGATLGNALRDLLRARA
ncbi:MAG: hypothetical protein FWD73_17845 [Polyangiaceae bacterium]|nr:hypothetical protein [Polyangiaceae bacterium]